MKRIEALGGEVSNSNPTSLEDFFLSLKFNNPLYQNPEYIPTTTNRFKEPLFDLDSFIKENKSLLKTNVTELDKKIIDKYTSYQKGCIGQYKCDATLYTPLKYGTEDYKTTLDSYSFNKECLKELMLEVQNSKPEFVELFYTCQFLRNGRFEAVYYYICTSDKNHENPTVYTTNEDCYFCEIENEGPLNIFLNTLMTKEELLKIIKNRMENLLN
ncbi:hypothetical protein [Dokdonia pacifica]|uniref:hypothetical protein n=1 Tax=Dokdonia pacifica TaxID=1627892 RepID=UPI001E64B5AE|nr:hypothetical protein [Dokdonia pacifica]